MSTSQPSNALAKRSASTALMPPPPAPKRIKRPTIVLDEDTYTSAINHIIRRDFFPGLAETDAQAEYLNALESKDKTWIREAGKKLTQVMTPLPAGQRRKAKSGIGGGSVYGGMTPLGRGMSETPKVWGSDTPVSVAGTEVTEDEDAEKKPEVDLNLSLGAFQSKYTSEDTESFSQIIDLQNLKRYEKNAWARTGNRYASKQRLAQQKLIASNPSTTEITTLTTRPSQDLDLRPAAPTMHKHTPFNTLMFAPDSVEDWTQTRAQRSELASLAPPKAVLHHNTRLPDISNMPARPPSPTMSAVRDAIAGRPRLSASEGGYTGSETPRVNGYAFVEATAPDSDSSDEEDAPTDLLERFGAKASTGNPFTINESQRRERLHHKMVERIAEKKSGREPSSSSSSSSFSSPSFPITSTSTSNTNTRGIFNPTDTPKFLSAPTPQRLGMTPGFGGAASAGAGAGGRKAGNLTPAAQRLFDRVGGGSTTPKNAGNGGFGPRSSSSSSSSSTLASTWTPTPKVKRRT
ncbi:hypothetical protein K504DRAFT_466216 [Pleomassaria siparia CBS 279.74]|uniref:Nuclear protein DGCR14 n=1 Tax=Pleomassaria siparia CBS 279.74 TaxID=1314801 RepID=A0A6G1KEE0_9PLEO|nr:hypothetical protein K504DRAFT_466216 [Pleomassaria siparia CBS 279.74]